MRYLLDTNIWVAISKGEAVANERLGQFTGNEVFSCAIVRAELMFGAFKSAKFHETLQGFERLLNGVVSLPFDDGATMAYGQIRAQMERAGTPIGSNDMFIAAIALVNNCVLVTRNEREFRRVPALQIDTWS